jgi:hypothetical protein
MSRSTNVVQECAKLVSEPTSLTPDFIGPLSLPGAREYDVLFAALDPNHAGYPPPIESLLQEPWSGTLQDMVGRGDDYESAGTKMLRTALLILEINKRLRERRVALLASAASHREHRRA